MTTLLEKMVRYRRGEGIVLRPREGSMFEHDAWGEDIGHEDEDPEAFDRDAGNAFSKKEQISVLSEGENNNKESVPDALSISADDGQRSEDVSSVSNVFVTNEVNNTSMYQSFVTKEDMALSSGVRDVSGVKNGPEVQFEEKPVYTEIHHRNNEQKQGEKLSYQKIIQHLDEQHVHIENGSTVLNRFENVQGNDITNITEGAHVTHHTDVMNMSDVVKTQKGSKGRQRQDSGDAERGVHIHIGSVHVRAQNQSNIQTMPAPRSVSGRATSKRSEEGAPSLDDYLEQQEKV